MMAEEIVLIVVATWSPISELRGGIPLGLSLGIDPVLTLFIAVVANLVLYLPIYIILELLWKRFLGKWKFSRFYLDHVRQKGKPWVDRYGFPGLALFVAVPLPFSGVYSGTTLSWVLGMDWKRAFLAIALGTFLAGVIVLLASLGIIMAIKSWI